MRINKGAKISSTLFSTTLFIVMILMAASVLPLEVKAADTGWVNRYGFQGIEDSKLTSVLYFGNLYEIVYSENKDSDINAITFNLHIFRKKGVEGQKNLFKFHRTYNPDKNMFAYYFPTSAMAENYFYLPKLIWDVLIKKTDKEFYRGNIYGSDYIEYVQIEETETGLICAVKLSDKCKYFKDVQGERGNFSVVTSGRKY